MISVYISILCLSFKMRSFYLVIYYIFTFFIHFNTSWCSPLVENHCLMGKAPLKKPVWLLQQVGEGGVWRCDSGAGHAEWGQLQGLDAHHAAVTGQPDALDLRHTGRRWDMRVLKLQRSCDKKIAVHFRTKFRALKKSVSDRALFLPCFSVKQLEVNW